MNEWISVKDGPNSNGPYLIYVPGHDPQVYQDAYGEIEAEKMGFAHELLFDTRVTHYMPLPKPPEKT